MPAGRPPKHLQLIEGHMTKEEREKREEGEKALATSTPFKIWPKTRKNKVAAKHFRRLAKAFAAIKQCDVLYEQALNRYCLLLAECEALEARIPRMMEVIQATETAWEKKCEGDEVPEVSEILDYANAIAGLNREWNRLDGALGAKRNALLQIEKENIMTVLGKLRAVPKQEQKTKKESGLADYNRRWGKGGE